MVETRRDGGGGRVEEMGLLEVRLREGREKIHNLNFLTFLLSPSTSLVVTMVVSKTRRGILVLLGLGNHSR